MKDKSIGTCIINTVLSWSQLLVLTQKRIISVRLLPMKSAQFTVSITSYGCLLICKSVPTICDSCEWLSQNWFLLLSLFLIMHFFVFFFSSYWCVYTGSDRRDIGASKVNFRQSTQGVLFVVQSVQCSLIWRFTLRWLYNKYFRTQRHKGNVNKIYASS